MLLCNFVIISLLFPRIAEGVNLKDFMMPATSSCMPGGTSSWLLEFIRLVLYHRPSHAQIGVPSLICFCIRTVVFPCDHKESLVGVLLGWTGLLSLRSPTFSWSTAEKLFDGNEVWSQGTGLGKGSWATLKIPYSGTANGNVSRNRKDVFQGRRHVFLWREE